MKEDSRYILTSLSELMGERYGSYAKYIIQDRALPDGRDGLKPVQRRILYAMSELNLSHKNPFKKAARVVGEVIGKYHPHGDSSIYDATVRMSQDWKFLHPLVEIHGNNGSVDGDNPAAMRYTEARLTKIGEFMLRDIHKGTVKFAWNFDDSEKEPLVLPSLIPSLLLNGATGIAAGYATNIPPHNLIEIIKACKHRILNPECNLSSLLRFIKGPDLPTGGIIENYSEIKNAYKTGKGKIQILSKISTEIDKNSKKIIIEEIPFEVNKADLIRNFEELSFSKQELQIKEVVDETDRFQLRISITLHKDADIENTLAFLINKTKLRVNYSINIVAIINRQPIESGIIRLIDCFISHAKNVILNKSKFEIMISQNKLHIIDGLIIAVNNLDKIIEIIKSSKNRHESIQNIIAHFKISNKQAEAIVDLKLYRLSSTNIEELKDSKKQLCDFVDILNNRVYNPKKLDEYLIGELELVSDEFGIKRKTKIEKESQIFEVDEQAMIIDEDVVIAITKKGYIKKIPSKNFDIKKYSEFLCASGDILLSHFDTNSLTNVLFITESGKYFVIPVNKIESSGWKRKGVHVSQYAKVSDIERIVSCVNLQNGFDTDSEIIIASKSGYIKRVAIKALESQRFTRMMTIMRLKPNDKIVGVDINNNGFVFCLTRNGFISKYGTGEISQLSPKASGTKAIALKNDFLVGISTAAPKDSLVLVSEKGAFKRVRVSEIPISKRINKGNKIVRPIKSNPTYFLDIFTKEKANWVWLLTIDGKNLVIPSSKILITDLSQSPKFFFDEKNIVDSTHDYCVNPIYNEEKLSNVVFENSIQPSLNQFKINNNVISNASNDEKEQTMIKKSKKFAAMSADQQELELEKTLSNLELTLDNLETTTKKAKEDIEETGQFQVSLDDMFDEE